MTGTHGSPARGRALPALLVAAAAAVGLVATSGGATPSEVVRGLRAAAAGPDYSLSATPGAIGVDTGGSATTTLAVTATRGWTGAVALSATGAPSGVSVAFGTASLGLTRTRTTAASAVTVTATPAVAAGRYAVTLVGTSGTTRRTTSLTVVVSVPVRVILSASPTRVVTQPAGPALRTTVTATTSGIATTTALVYKVAGLPAGASASFSTGSTTTARTTVLTVTLSRTTPLGTWPLTVTAATATGKPASGSTTVTLVVEAAGLPFTVSGPSAAPRLAPGLSAALDVALTNPNATAVSVTALTVTVTSTSNEAACPAATHFRTVALAAPVSVPAGASRTLSQLGVATTAMPAVRMLDLTTNQDACKGVTLTLAYAGTADGGVR